MKLILKKVYTVSNKRDEPRLWLQHLVCESAGLVPGSELYVEVNETDKRIIIRNRPREESPNVFSVSVSSRKSRTSGEARPLVDTSGAKYSSIMCIQDKIEISVYRDGEYAEIEVRPLKFRLFETEKFSTPDERIRLLTVCSGSGVGASIFVDSSYYTAVQEVEIAEDCADVIKANFPHSYLFNGDLRDCNTVAKADVAFISLDCSEHSNIGQGDQGYFDNLVLGTYKILKAAEPRVIFSENVPQFYHSAVFHDLKELLTIDYPYVIGPLTIDSYDFGSIAHRKRSYMLFVQNEEDFNQFRQPKIPSFRRLKLKDYLDPKGTPHEWKSLEKWWESFSAKKEKNNSWANRSTEKTFVEPETCTEIQCIPARYRSYSASNSYVLSESGDRWRFLSISELRKIFSIPSWFHFPTHIPKNRIYEMIGQSVCGRVIRAFANEISSLFFRRFASTAKKDLSKVNLGVIREQDGQLGFAF
ncbi:DNA cytosine methyltransferase [Paenibacillus illinoisensis]|uniref:DNA cytosine methyltransferase n=1 Tax=Paenibacillus illinoisensis TaxID=59845 RepID=UPI00301D6C51